LQRYFSLIISTLFGIACSDAAHIPLPIGEQAGLSSAVVVGGKVMQPGSETECYRMEKCVQSKPAMAANQRCRSVSP
jgi:hypothetical protein